MLCSDQTRLSHNSVIPKQQMHRAFSSHESQRVCRALVEDSRDQCVLSVTAPPRPTATVAADVDECSVADDSNSERIQPPTGGSLSTRQWLVATEQTRATAAFKKTSVAVKSALALALGWVFDIATSTTQQMATQKGSHSMTLSRSYIIVLQAGTSTYQLGTCVCAYSTCCEYLPVCTPFSSW